MASRVAYGGDPAQFGELYRPDRPVHPGVVVIVHGGFWRARYDLTLGRPLAADLAAHGFTCWNVEYRRVAAGGGWPATAQDVSDAIDHLASMAVDASRVVAVGHSAGGHLAVWAATARPHARVPLTAAVSQAGVLDLATAARSGVGGTAVLDFVGGRPEDFPERYAAADPMQHVPPRAPVLCVHVRNDEDVPFAQSESYVAAAGDRARLVEVPGDHYTVIDPQHESWRLVRNALPELLAGRLPR